MASTSDTDLKLILHNQQQRLIFDIEYIYHLLPRKKYFPQRFDKKYIVDLTRSGLRKRNVITQWNDEKLYEFALNAIEYIVITLPAFRENLRKTGLNKDDIARMFNYKRAKTMLSSSAKYKKIRSINMLIEATFRAQNIA